jgi:PAS domain-containing protein
VADAEALRDPANPSGCICEQRLQRLLRFPHRQQDGGQLRLSRFQLLEALPLLPPQLLQLLLNGLQAFQNRRELPFQVIEERVAQGSSVHLQARQQLRGDDAEDDVVVFDFMGEEGANQVEPGNPPGPLGRLPSLPQPLDENLRRLAEPSPQFLQPLVRQALAQLPPSLLGGDALRLQQEGQPAFRNRRRRRIFGIGNPAQLGGEFVIGLPEPSALLVPRLTEGKATRKAGDQILDIRAPFPQGVGEQAPGGLKEGSADRLLQVADRTIPSTQAVVNRSPEAAENGVGPVAEDARHDAAQHKPCPRQLRHACAPRTDRKGKGRTPPERRG